MQNNLPFTFPCENVTFSILKETSQECTFYPAITLVHLERERKCFKMLEDEEVRCRGKIPRNGGFLLENENRQSFTLAPT